ncbi:MAG: patatin-like phospholipase family protein [Trichloromonadaceae bacterium]
MKVALALGGGAARGLAHIGILEVFQEENFPVDIIAGTSMGAIIGAMYATDPDLPAIRQRFRDYLVSPEFKQAKFDFIKDKDKADIEGEGIFYKFSQFARKGLFLTNSITRRAFLSEQTSHSNLAFLVPDRAIETTRTPFCATAMDLIAGEEHLFTCGSLQQALRASCAIPGIMPPLELQGRQLVDGGWIDAIPVRPARKLGADFVIAVDVGRDITEFEPPRSALDIVFRADAITRHALSRQRLSEADYVLCPSTGRTHWADFARMDELIDSGRREALQHLDELRRQLKRRRLKYFFLGGEKS